MKARPVVVALLLSLTAAFVGTYLLNRRSDIHRSSFRTTQRFSRLHLEDEPAASAADTPPARSTAREERSKPRSRDGSSVKVVHAPLQPRSGQPVLITADLQARRPGSDPVL